LPFLSSDKSPSNFGRYKDPLLDDLYLKQSGAMDPVERRKLTRQFQARVMGEMAYAFPALGWAKRIILQSSMMKGWNPMPSHYLNMDLVDIWLEKE
jgi:peptide/nickel transport system substrate-binding protein